MNHFQTELFVYIVVSEDIDSKETILLVTVNEELAASVIEALDEADTQHDYEYRAVKHPVVR